MAQQQARDRPASHLEDRPPKTRVHLLLHPGSPARVEQLRQSISASAIASASSAIRHLSATMPRGAPNRARAWQSTVRRCPPHVRPSGSIRRASPSAGRGRRHHPSRPRSARDGMPGNAAMHSSRPVSGQYAATAHCAADVPRSRPQTASPTRTASASCFSQVAALISTATPTSLTPRFNRNASKDGRSASSAFAAFASRRIAISAGPGSDRVTGFALQPCAATGTADPLSLPRVSGSNQDACKRDGEGVSPSSAGLVPINRSLESSILPAGGAKRCQHLGNPRFRPLR